MCVCVCACVGTNNNNKNNKKINMHGLYIKIYPKYFDVGERWRHLIIRGVGCLCVSCLLLMSDCKQK